MKEYKKEERKNMRMEERNKRRNRIKINGRMRKDGTADARRKKETKRLRT